MKVARVLRPIAPLAILALISGCDTPVVQLALSLQQAVTQHRWDEVNRALRQSLSSESRYLLEARINEFYLRKAEPGCSPFSFSPRVVFTVARVSEAASGNTTLTQSLALLTAEEDSPEARVALSATVQCAVTRATAAKCPVDRPGVRYVRSPGAATDGVFAIDGDLLGGFTINDSPIGGRAPSEAQLREAARRRDITHQLYPELGCVTECRVVAFDVPAELNRAAPEGTTWLNASSTPELRERIQPSRPARP